MATFEYIQQQLKDTESTVVAIGNFDGVHLGHQEVFKRLKKIAEDLKAQPLVLILYPHPKEIFTGSSPALLTTLKDRMEMIRAMGIQHVFDLKFDLEFAEVSADNCLRMFRDKLNMQHMVIGPTTHIGKNREGSPVKIVTLSKQIGFDVTVLEQQSIHDCKISSSQIREFISQGNMRQTSQLLGRNYVVHGVVETGAGKGKQIGFPTANVAQIQTIVPMRGVYAGRATLDGTIWKAAINVGTRPTVTSSPEIVVECHLIDFDRKIVGKALEIEWVDRLRNEVKFASIDELRNQIQLDVRNARSIL